MIKQFAIVLKYVRAVVKAADIEKSLKKTVASVDHKYDRDAVSLGSKWAGTETNCEVASTVCADSCMRLAKRRRWLLACISSIYSSA